MVGSDDSREAELALQELLPSLVRELETTREEAAEKEKRDNLRQGAIEYWKSYYDFFKHLATISLAAIAGFGALLGGAFSDATWEGYVLFGFLPLIYLSRSAIMLWTFAGFFLAAIAGFGAMTVARSHLYHVGTLETGDELDEHHNKSTMLRSRAGFIGLAAFVPLSVAILGFGIYVARSVVALIEGG
jgi:hypothetical protein